MSVQANFVDTVQLRYIRTTHTHIIRAYFAYTRMYIRAYTRVYTRVYVPLLCIPISFFIWSIVSQTRHYFYGIKKGKICILLKRHADEWKLSYFEFSITSQIQRPTTIFWHLLDVMKATKNGKTETVAWTPHFNAWSLCFYKQRSVFWYVSASRLHHVYLAFLRKIDPRRKKWYLWLYLTQIIHSNGKMLFAWRKNCLSKFLWCATHV